MPASNWLLQLLLEAKNSKVAGKEGGNGCFLVTEVEEDVEFNVRGIIFVVKKTERLGQLIDKIEDCFTQSISFGRSDGKQHI